MTNLYLIPSEATDARRVIRAMNAAAERAESPAIAEMWQTISTHLEGAIVWPPAPPGRFTTAEWLDD